MSRTSISAGSLPLDLARVNPALEEDHHLAGLGRGLRRDLSGMFVLWGTLDGYVLFQR